MSDPFGNAQRGPRGPVGPSPETQRRSRRLVITAAVLVVLFVAFSAFAGFWTERLWFSSVEFSDVFTTLVVTRILLGLAFGVLAALVIGVSAWTAHRFRPFFRSLHPDQDPTERYRQTLAPIKGWALAGVAVIAGVLAAMSASGQWREFQMWRHAEKFGTTDPFFDRDAGFYVFQLPWFHFLVDFTMSLTVVALVVTILVHYVYGGISLAARGADKLSPAAQVQISILLGFFVLAKALDFYLDRFDLLSESGALITGMNYTDENAVLPAKNILAGIALICAVLFFLNVWRRTWVLPTVGVALLGLSTVLLGMLWPGIVQRFQVEPNKADKESEYISRNIEATRAAYDLEDIEVSRYQSAPDLGTALTDLEKGTSSVPLVDPKLVRKTFEQQQQVRAYYSVADVLDVDRYELDGEERALVLGVREINQAGLAASDQNWTNQATVYTHGTGMIAAYANQRPGDNKSQASVIQWAEGQEANQNALTELNGGEVESRIYFGENSPAYSVVGKGAGDKSVELDLPSGDEDQKANPTVTYDGKGGVPVGNILTKSLYALKFGEPNFILSKRVNENSKVLYDRDPRTMVEKVAPWLTVDSDPYPVVTEGRIQWVLDGYTVTDKYPLSQKASFEEMTKDSLQTNTGFQTLPTDEINYVRNSVKATVDAYDGTVTLYAWDDSDPVLKVWREVFPDTVKDKSEIPESLMSHLRYPEDLFKAQRYQFAKYHVTDPKDWYAGSNRWEVPEDPNSQGNLQPPYRLFTNPQGDEDPNAEQVWSLTSVFVPREKNNLSAFVSVNSDATSPDYGKIQVLELADERTNGPALVANEIASDEDVRDELFSFDQGGITPQYGNLLTLPVGDGLMYVQPLYAARNASESSYPILSFVLVSYGGKVGIAPTLRGAIADVLGVEDAASPTPTDPGTPGEEKPVGSVDDQIRAKLAEAEKAFTAADKAQRSGDTVTWATEIEKAKKSINDAVTLSDKAKAAAAAATKKAETKKAETKKAEEKKD
ncbi:UPF0182 family protein [Nocardioides yefusunii]|uniref:UPF0182 protein ACFPWU_12680 n=1 Tax=Nocardioides yefusunii TaxID=2500546 RepID=A0ABW1R087_9ACTN|nr:UPF0182 family protein [Nocardioides yefusunii]